MCVCVCYRNSFCVKLLYKLKTFGHILCNYLQQGDYVFGSVCLFVYIFVCQKVKRIAMKFYGEVWGGKRNK